MNVVDVDVAGCVGDDGDEAGVASVMRLAAFEDVLEAPEPMKRTHPEPPSPNAEAHAAVEGPLEHRKAAVGFQADREQLARVVGHECDAGFLGGVPAGEDARAARLRRRPA